MLSKTRSALKGAGWKLRSNARTGHAQIQAQRRMV